MGMLKSLKQKIDKPWYSFENKGNKQARIEIFDSIGQGFFTDGYTAKDFAKELKNLGEIDEIELAINSNGGDVFDGFAIYEMLKNHPANVTVKVEAIAASIASVIAMAGDKIIMAENGFYMIHQPRGVAFGGSKEMRKTADTLDKFQEKIVDTYMNRAKVERSEIERMVNEETWIDAKAALDMGLADETTESVKAAAFFEHDYSAFNQMPAKLLETLSTDEKEEEMTKEEIEALVASQVAPFTAQLENANSQIAAANAQAEAAKKELEDLKNKINASSATNRADNINARLNACVASGRVSPQERDSVVALLDGLDDSKVNAYLATLEGRTVSNSVNNLTREITTKSGKKKSIVVDRMFTIPTNDGGRGPDAETIAMMDELLDGTETYEDFRQKAYAANGEQVSSGSSIPFLSGKGSN